MKVVVFAVDRHGLGNWWRVVSKSVLHVVSHQGTSHQPSILLGQGAATGSQGVRWHYSYGSVAAGGGRTGYRAPGLSSSLSCASRRSHTPFCNTRAGVAEFKTTKGLC